MSKQPIEEKWKERLKEIEREWMRHRMENTCSICDSPNGHTTIESFIENLLEQERKRMSDEVNKLLPKDWAEKADKAKKEGDMYTGGFFMGMIDTVEKVLQILKR